MDTKWKDLTPERKIGIIIVILGAVLMAVAMLKPDLFGVKMTTPALAIMSFGEALSYFRTNRKWFWLFAAAAVISMACFLLDLFLL